MRFEHESYDAVVVGSGYGGSVAACRLSAAGISVCLIEKGRRWEGQEFPRNFLSLMSSLRMEWSKLGVGFGSQTALFQIRNEGDSLAAVGCGVGGGSLINGGVLVPTSLRVRNDPKWPKEWNKDWEHYEALASSMLGAQSAPFEFSIGRVIRQIVSQENEIEDYKPDPIKLSINFGREEEEEENKCLIGSKRLGSCLACGNCLSGCPYDAKNSTDKNYLALAVEAGCVVRTESKVQCVVQNPCEISDKRRWRVFLDDLEYVCADFVILSAGVLGTSEILFQSQRRGLGLSERLGFGVSCNGNNVAFVTGSRTPLNAYGLSMKQFSEIPFQNRPGPSISASFTSSVGFTIQSGVLPTSYPNLLFKGIVTYGWPSGYWFLHGLIEKIKCSILGMKESQSVILNVMGYDAADGRITFDEEAENIRITPPHDPLLPEKIIAFQNMARKLGGILFMSRYRSTSVHLLGGCNGAPKTSVGVCNLKGQVFRTDLNQSAVHEGLYVSDASLIPCSLGTNPCLTITALAERISRFLVDDVLRFKGAVQQQESLRMELGHNTLVTVSEKIRENESDPVVVRETMRGFIEGMPCTAYLTMKINCRDEGGNQHPSLRGRVGGYVVFHSVSKGKLFVLDGKVDLCQVDSRIPYTQQMHYFLILASASGSRYTLEGKKVMNPYLLAFYAWHESTTLHVTFRQIENKDINDQQSNSSEPQLILHGELHISVFELLKCVARLKGKQRGKFVCLLLQSLWKTYISQIPRHSEEALDSSKVNQGPYPLHILHTIKTEDGYTISCKQWKSKPIVWKLREEKKQYPVLLLNGYSGESYCLPTEKSDLVRTLLDEGYDIWLLHPRLHPLHPSNNFTIEDIGKFDIPAVIAKIREDHGTFSRVHVIAHCVGGLAIHIALLGGHVSASHLASLSCTNSSMYFKLTTSALVKMKLPLLPVSMAVLGKNQTLSITDSSKDEFRHSILKSLARIIPRTECCTYDECTIFSGIFGNAFWHVNISKTIHHWLNKQNVTHLPMSGFPHLRSICNAGFVVDAEGKDKYLIHSERMALPTLYISGGRSLLVTPETSMLANRYMRLHQPRFQHKRVVVEGFGHSDLLIGEDSYNSVFPHFISHIRMAEGGGRRKGNDEEKEGGLISWEGLHDEKRGLGGFAIFICLIVIFCVYYVIII